MNKIYIRFTADNIRLITIFVANKKFCLEKNEYNLNDWMSAEK